MLTTASDIQGIAACFLDTFAGVLEASHHHIPIDADISHVV